MALKQSTYHTLYISPKPS